MSIQKKKTLNIDFIIGMAEGSVNSGDHIGFKLDKNMLKCIKARLKMPS